MSKQNVKPIIMSTEDVRGIRDGRKTMTRAVINPQPTYWNDGECVYNKDSIVGPELYNPIRVDKYGEQYPGKEVYGIYSDDGEYGCKAPCQPGDVLITAVKIDGQSEQYCAGSDGYVYSQKQGEWKRLAGCPTSKGYLSVTLSEYGKRSTKSVSVVICKAFYGDPPNSHSQVRHLNGVQTDNRPANLAWGTQYENWADRKVHGHGIDGEKHPQSKFSNKERANIRWAISNGLTSVRNAARALCVSQTVIQGVMKGNELITKKQEIPKNRFPELFLRVTDVRVERVQEITATDAVREGVARGWGLNNVECLAGGCYNGDFDKSCALCDVPVEGFRQLWDARNAARGYRWYSNPWVWVIEFEECDKHYPNQSLVVKQHG